MRKLPIIFWIAMAATPASAQSVTETTTVTKSVTVNRGLGAGTQNVCQTVGIVYFSRAEQLRSGEAEVIGGGSQNRRFVLIESLPQGTLNLQKCLLKVLKVGVLA
jgi:hypothetical protein